jgi:hypothetical protein
MQPDTCHNPSRTHTAAATTAMSHPSKSRPRGTGYLSFASSLIWTLPLSAPETGQPFFAASAACRNLAWSIPATCHAP